MTWRLLFTITIEKKNFKESYSLVLQKIIRYAPPTKLKLYIGMHLENLQKYQPRNSSWIIS